MFFNRTKIYSVYIKRGSSKPLEECIFVRDGFNFWAFVLTYIWAFCNRLWLVGAMLLVISIMLLVADGGFSTFMISLLIHVFFGMEANNLKSQKLERTGYIVFDVVTGIDEIAAKQRFFDKYLLKERQLKSHTFSQAQASQSPLGASA